MIKEGYVKMKVISLVTQKGGSGKSTLTVSLAVAAQEAGHSVCILEMDKQATVHPVVTDTIRPSARGCPGDSGPTGRSNLQAASLI
jgi:molybdopterin-guanine dinucleotide biosynthesis protein